MNSKGLLKKGITLSTLEERVRFHIDFINLLLPEKLVKKEVEVIVKFLLMDKSMTKITHFTSKTRKLVQQELNITPSNLSGYLNSIAQKGLIYKEEDTRLLFFSKSVINFSDNYEINIRG